MQNWFSKHTNVITCNLFIGYRSNPEQTTSCQLSVTTSSLTHQPVSLTFSLCTPLPVHFILLQTHGYFVLCIPHVRTKKIGQCHSSCCAQKHWNFPPLFVMFLLCANVSVCVCVCVCVCVHVCVRECVGVVCEEYNMTI